MYHPLVPKMDLSSENCVNLSNVSVAEIHDIWHSLQDGRIRDMPVNISNIRYRYDNKM